MADQQIKVVITATGEDLKREIDSDITALNRLQAATLATNKAGIASTREAIDSQRQYMESVNASGDSFNRLDQLEQRFETRVQSAATRNTTALNSMARGFSVLESSAHASVRSIDAISNAASQLAFGFGPQGMLIGAVTMVGIAIVRAFRNAKDAVVDLRTKAETEFMKLGEDLNAEAAHQQFVQAQMQYDAMKAKVDALTQSYLKHTMSGSPIGQAQSIYDIVQLKSANAQMGELNAEADKYYAIWQSFAALKPMSELVKESKDVVKELKQQAKLEAEYVAKYGGDAIYNEFLKKNQKVKPFSPGADITADVMKIKPPALDKTDFQKSILDPLDQWTKSLHVLTDAHKLLAGVSTSVFAGIVGAMANMGGGVKAMKKALLEPIYSWLKATAISEFIEGMKALFSLNPVVKATAAGHFLTAAEAGAGAAVVGALGGIGGGGGGAGGGGGGGGSGGSSSASNSATALGAGPSTQLQTLTMEVIITQKDMDGKQTARLRQKFQRLDDLAQPLRTTM